MWEMDGHAVSQATWNRRNAAKKKELEEVEKRIAELSAIFKRLYEDSVAGAYRTSVSRGFRQTTNTSKRN